MGQSVEALPVVSRPAPALSLVDAPRRPRGLGWWVFGVLATLLVGRNWNLFVTPMVEEGDAAANSILVDNAKHFSQLVGNYSRVGFHHPGPGFLYVHAVGEWLLYDVLGVVPSEWNGQAIAILLLNAALIAIAVHIVGRWFAAPAGTRWVELAVAATALIFVGSWLDLATSTWPPFEYFAPYLLLLAAATSVAAGGIRDLWALCLATGLLVHGHAEFLFLGVGLAGVALVCLLAPHRRNLRGYLRANRRPLLWAAPVLALALLPIVLNLILHWPGEFGRYLGYGDERSPNGLFAALWYVMRAWDADPLLAPVVLVGSLTAMVLAVRRSRHPYARRALLIVGLSLLTIVVYAVIGIDSLGEQYIVFFSRALPLFALLVSVAVAVKLGPSPKAVTLILTGAALLLGLFSPTMLNRQVIIHDAPQALARVGDPSRPVVLHLATAESWAEALPLALEGRRHGERFCFVDPGVAMMATPSFMCTPDEAATGVQLTVARWGNPQSGLRWVTDLGLSRIWAAPDYSPRS